jgi:hypothetical protein
MVENTTPYVSEKSGEDQVTNYVYCPPNLSDCVQNRFPRQELIERSVRPSGYVSAYRFGV